MSTLCPYQSYRFQYIDSINFILKDIFHINLKHCTFKRFLFNIQIIKKAEQNWIQFSPLIVYNIGGHMVIKISLILTSHSVLSRTNSRKSFKSAKAKNLTLPSKIISEILILFLYFLGCQLFTCNNREKFKNNHENTI